MDCEFFAIINDASSDKLSLPKKFVDLLEGREPRELKVREVGIRHTSTWDMDVWFDGTGRMFLKRAWECFAWTYGLQQFYFPICSYNSRDVLTVKMFDRSMCHVQYDTTYSTRTL
ncbi:B3 domain-containing protein Os03g0212300-like [Lolium perenne]|uniref:B3 domain-containing protein Os03g0212300-like n=1 Tax=Lolium perenne TaxID=4522 RepID=UPI0021F55597|nr:B3 domain-containing protein Os03g0212300-like [Lolium perenne]